MLLSARGAQPSQRYDTSIPDTLYTVIKRQDNDLCLPSQVVAALPECALSCVQDFVANSFGAPACIDASDLNFLCTTQAQGGFTLGEGGLRCVLSNCARAEQRADVYFACDGINGAQPKTQATITATINPSTTVRPPARGTVTSSQSATDTSSSNGGPPTITSISPPDLTSFGFVTADTPFPAPTAAAAPATSRTGTSPGQVAGIAVGSVAGFLALLGLIFLFCYRRRRAAKNPNPPGSGRPASLLSSSDGLIDPSGPPGVDRGFQQRSKNPSPVETIAAAVEAAQAGIMTPAGAAALGPSSISPPLTARAKARSYLRKSIRPEEIGVAVSPKEGVNFARKSLGSTIASQSRSMLPIPESSVLPTAFSPTTSIGGASEQLGERTSFATISNFPVVASMRQTPWLGSATTGQAYIDEKIPVHADIEAQEAFPRPPERTSLLSSARASLVGLGAMLVKKVSLKRQPSDARPLLKPGENRSGGTQTVNKFTLTPTYDNGYFVPNPPLTSSTTSPPDTVIGSPQQPAKIQRKPTFSSFVAGKLLPSSSYKGSPPSGNVSEAVESLSQAQQESASRALMLATKPSSRSIVARKAVPLSKRLVNAKAPGMMPAPLLIRKSQSSKIFESDASVYTPYPESATPSNPPLPNDFALSISGAQASIVAQTPQKVMEIMGLAKPANIQRYSQKPLPKPKQEPNPFDNIPPLTDSSQFVSTNNLAAIETVQGEKVDTEQEKAENLEPPLSAATSWLSVPISTAPATERGTMIQNSPYRAAPISMMQTPMESPPRGRPAFPSATPSLSSIYTRNKHATTQLPAITPISAMTLTSAKYKPTLQQPPAVPSFPLQSTPSSFLQDPSPLPPTGLKKNRISEVLSNSDNVSTGIASNVSSPQKFTRNINPYNPYFPPIPTRQPSASSTKSQSLALSSHPTAAVPKLTFATDPGSIQEAPGNVQKPMTEHPFILVPSPTPGLLGYRHNSELFSPDSADPSRDSLGLNPKVTVTPNRTPGGDLVLTVDTTGKGYGF